MKNQTEEMKRIFAVVMTLCFLLPLRAQQPAGDSVETLQTVEVKAFEQNRKLWELPAAVVVIGKSQLQRFSNSSLVPVLSSQPGIRMEERSPGSYRLNIRGSSLRAPFGVRNVKVYYNDIPYTTPGGDTYLNQLGFYQISSLEVIKGPGSSLYGAGTGGVLLVNSDPDRWRRGMRFDLFGGTYKLYNYNVNLRSGSEGFQNTFNFQSQGSDGYRQQSALTRKVLSWDLASRLSNKSRLNAHWFYSDLFYETPGGLNRKEFDSIPYAARPRVGNVPGAISANASMRQKTFFSGIHYRYQIAENWEESTSLYGAFTRLRNPGIFNYSWVNEAHTGGRTTLSYRKPSFSAQLGMELQQGFTTAKTFKNAQGNPDSLRTDDEVNNRQLMGFAQFSWNLRPDIVITGGVSISQLRASVTRLSNVPSSTQQRRYNNEWAPRLALLKKFGQHHSVYASIAKGFSPPTTSEILPSSGIIATELEAEKGLNGELGSRGSLGNGRLTYDINIFQFRLRQAIVIRRDSLGRDYFVNAGSTRQQGMETQLNYWWQQGKGKTWSASRFWVSHTWYRFRYTEFIKGNTNFSGKRLPSVPGQALVAGLDAQLKTGLYARMTYTYTDPIPLNDGNTDWSPATHVVGLRAGYLKKLSEKIQYEFFISGDNLTNTRYSLGFDLNAAGGRYFNTAPLRNWTIGANVTLP